MVILEQPCLLALFSQVVGWKSKLGTQHFKIILPFPKSYALSLDVQITHPEITCKELIRRSNKSKIILLCCGEQPTHILNPLHPIGK